MLYKKRFFIFSICLASILSSNSFAQRTWENDNDPSLIPDTGSARHSGTKDMMDKYADGLIAQMSTSGHCANFVHMLRQVASSGGHDVVRKRQIDKIFDKSVDAGCL